MFVLPWQCPNRRDDPDRFPLALSGALVIPGSIDEAVLTEVLASAAAVVSGWIGVEFEWTTSAWGHHADGGDPSDYERAGVDLEFVAGKHPVSTVYLGASCVAMRGYEGHPKHRVGEVVASCHEAFFSDAEPQRPWTALAVSMHRWAMYGGGTEHLPRFAGQLAGWLTDTAARLGAVGGYASLDTMYGLDCGRSALEYVLAQECGERGSPDRRSTMWGYGWGTLLTGAHVERLGGTARLEEIPDATVARVGEELHWVQLGKDPSVVPDESMWRLHDVLLPVLPPAAAGIRPGMEAFEPGAVVDAGALAAQWDADARAARELGRSHGLFGPVGFTVAAGVPELMAPFSHLVALDYMTFSRLDGATAGTLLGRLGQDVLDVREGGPTLRAVLRTAAANAGVVLPFGHVVGPRREDERVTAEGVVVVGDPVLDELGPRERKAAWARVQDLGLNDALRPPDELRRTRQPRKGQAAPSAWTVWWD